MNSAVNLPGAYLPFRPVQGASPGAAACSSAGIWPEGSRSLICDSGTTGGAG